MHEGKEKIRKRKRIQLIMWWLLPIIIFGGIFWPYIGYLVLCMMLFFFVLSAFRGRYWCGWFCPRGSFLERILVYISRNKKIPSFFKDMKFRWPVFYILISFMILRLIQSGGAAEKIGFVFVTMCTITTAIAIPLGIIFKPRVWCAFCPMGTLQGIIGRNKYLLSISADCVECGTCEKNCPIGTNPVAFKVTEKVKSIDCLRCPDCMVNCSKNALRFNQDGK
jgi:ferredoxin-type protein NapH